MRSFHLDGFLRASAFADVDRRFARFIAREDGGHSHLVGAAAAAVSYQLRRGHVFLDLVAPPVWDDPSQVPAESWPELEIWRESLRASPVVGAPGETKPLLLTESGRLYLQRYWSYEKLLAEKLRERAKAVDDKLPEETESRLAALFSDAEDQKKAARNALLRPFSLISGGPGTGKTTTVLKILMLLLERDPELQIQMAAPTGKAAARLQESVREGLGNVDCPPDVRARIDEKQASTIHRLLGPISGSVYFRHNATNPLAADVVVLDEASMVDLPLMAKLFDALDPKCRVIVLGDKDQLASVEAGSVLSGIVEAAIVAPAGRDCPPLEGVVTLLNKNFRFGNESSIFGVCNAVRDGDMQSALEIFRNGAVREVNWSGLPGPGEMKEQLRPLVVDRFGTFVRLTDPGEALGALRRFQILTALRHGPYGKENINLLVEEILREEGAIPPGRRNFPGRPLMVTENDYALRLFNGDIGVLLEDEEGKLMAFFRNEEGTIRKVSPLRLPFTEPAFAMTVHKSQGSEFDEVLAVLPARDTRVLTRELLYTAISRARAKVGLWSEEETLRSTIGRKVRRGAGLAEMLCREGG